MDLGNSRLLLISNRLPVTVTEKEKAKWEFKASSGGLATGLKGLAKSATFSWWGWPGIDVAEEDKQSLKDRLMDEHSAVPIFVDSRLADRHYNGFSNSILWPLFHYFPEKMSFDEASGKAYRDVNQIYADAVAPELRDGDLVWVHDYHLMLLPAMLRDRIGDKKVKIGFFLHTPFPSSDFFTILPMRDELLNGLLACDLVGFHTEEYAEHFRASCTKILHLREIEGKIIQHKNRMVKTFCFPIGIEPEEFQKGLQSEEVKGTISALERAFEGKTLIVGVDRMDYIKGVPQKLHAFDKFLTDNPEYQGKVMLLQVGVPTRPDVEEYQKLRDEVNGLVGDINGRHGGATYMPIHFMHKSISQQELMAFYAICDVCLVSSTRDGMNLVSYEYVACQDERAGVLVISQFTGVAQVLENAMQVNPWDADEFSMTIKKAIEMKPDERRKQHDANAKVVKELTSFYWGKTFLQQLKDSGAGHAVNQDA